MASSAATTKGYQFGTFKGVFTPSILTILGVVMYLRFGWVLGNVGLWKTLLIVTMSTAITFFTGLSLSALATNMKIGGGGAYFIISRSLGLEAGAAIGLPLFFAQALGIAFYVAGFSESVTNVFPALNPVWVGVVTLIGLATLAYISADLALRTQYFVMAAIVISMISFFLGAGTVDAPAAVVDAPAKLDFFAVFAVFFPAVTGIEAGIAMSGDLKDPAKSLPRGTIAAVLTGYLVYMTIPIVLSRMVHDPNTPLSLALLRDDPLVMRRVALWGDAIIAGVWAASLSSAMGALLGAPRTLQALANDRVLPTVMGKGYGRGNDPRLATAVCFLIGLAGILLGNLNIIAPVLSMFFLTSYGTLNIAAGLEELTSPPSWRPTFRVPWWLSLTGAAGCFAAMFMINAGATIMALIIAIGVYWMMKRRSLQASWGDMRSGLFMMLARQTILALDRRGLDERTWKPNILILSGSPNRRWYLIELARAISRDRGFLTVAAVLPEDTEAEHLSSFEGATRAYLDKRDVPALVKVYAAPTPIEGAIRLVTTYGFGPITPNTIMLGETQQPENYRGFCELVLQIHRHQKNLVIVREGEEPRQFEEGGRIDLWWGGADPHNLGFMLAIAYLLNRSSGWRQSKLMMKTVVTDAGEHQAARDRLREFIASVRVKAVPEVSVKGETPVFDLIREQSRGADLVFIGMRPPAAGEDAEAYSKYYAQLLEQTAAMPPLAIVLAAEEIDFYGIFQE